MQDKIILVLGYSISYVCSNLFEKIIGLGLQIYGLEGNWSLPQIQPLFSQKEVSLDGFKFFQVRLRAVLVNAVPLLEIGCFYLGKYHRQQLVKLLISLPTYNNQVFYIPDELLIASLGSRLIKHSESESVELEPFGHKDFEGDNGTPFGNVALLWLSDNFRLLPNAGLNHVSLPVVDQGGVADHEEQLQPAREHNGESANCFAHVPAVSQDYLPSMSEEEFYCGHLVRPQSPRSERINDALGHRLRRCHFLEDLLGFQGQIVQVKILILQNPGKKGQVLEPNHVSLHSLSEGKHFLEVGQRGDVVREANQQAVPIPPILNLDLLHSSLSLSFIFTRPQDHHFHKHPSSALLLLKLLSFEVMILFFFVEYLLNFCYSRLLTLLSSICPSIVRYQRQVSFPAVDELGITEAFAILQGIDLVVQKFYPFAKAVARQPCEIFLQLAQRYVALDDRVDGDCIHAMLQMTSLHRKQSDARPCPRFRMACSSALDPLTFP